MKEQRKPSDNEWNNKILKRENKSKYLRIYIIQKPSGLFLEEVFK